jgi:hypothetical protein
MPKKNILATTYKTYKNLVDDWVKPIKLNDIAFFIWPLYNDPDYRIDQFTSDKGLIKSSLGNKKIIFLHTSFLNNPELTSKELIYTELLIALRDKVGNKIDYSYGLIETLKFLESKEYKLVFFIEGLDRQMFQNNYLVVEEIYSLHQKLKKTSFLFFLQYPISITQLSNNLQNLRIFTNIISYQGAFSNDDSLQFCKYLQNKWGTQINNKLNKYLVRVFSNNYGLIKNAIRIFRFDKSLSMEQLMNHQTILERAKITLNMLSKELISAIQNNEQIHSVFLKKYHSVIEYLIASRMVKVENGKLNFICNVYNKLILDKSDKKQENSDFINQQLSLKEELVFTELNKNINKIITRERIGDVIWGEEVDDLYSEWAIDQTIHRLRQKMIKFKIPFELITKKQRGFIFKNK